MFAKTKNNVKNIKMFSIKKKNQEIKKSNNACNIAILCLKSRPISLLLNNLALTGLVFGYIYFPTIFFI